MSRAGVLGIQCGVRADSISSAFAAFTHDLCLDDIPAAARDRARYSILDAIGVAQAAAGFSFARQAADALKSISGHGSVPVIGMPLRLPVREAAFLNGILIHGLDYDDTHLKSAVHPTASLLPTVLSVGYARGSSGREMLTAYIAGIEAISRLGMFGGVRLREAGFHPTSVIGIFGCTLAAGKLLGMTPAGMVMAQGIVLSMASGMVGSVADGASNKRLHPGWASQAAITAAFLARAGIQGPTRAYEGVRGVFSLLERRDGSVPAALAQQVASLGSVWESERLSIKPIPACHLTHACSDAAVYLRNNHKFQISDIRRITALVPQGIVQAVCEPLELKRRPTDSYAAQFSIPYIVAASLIRGAFGLAELEPGAICDAEILAVAAKVEYQIDDKTTYPAHRTGELRIELRDGTVLCHREAINRGAPDRPLSFEEIENKFRANAARRVSGEQAAGIAESVLAIEAAPDGRRMIDIACGSAKDCAGQPGVSEMAETQ